MARTGTADALLRNLMADYPDATPEELGAKLAGMIELTYAKLAEEYGAGKAAAWRHRVLADLSA